MNLRVFLFIQDGGFRMVTDNLFIYIVLYRYVSPYNDKRRTFISKVRLFY